MASALRQLKDADLEHIHHMIRRDAKSDLEIAIEAERRLGAAISETNKGRINIISRYRNSRAYQAWLKRWNSQRSEMEQALSAQRHRFELIKDVLSNGGEYGLEKVSNALQARALALAAEADDEEFLAGLAGKGPYANALKLAQATVRDVYRQKVEELKDQLRKLAETDTDGKAAAGVSMDVVVDKVDEIMGLK